MTVGRSGARAASPAIDDESDGVEPDAIKQQQRGSEMQWINEVRTALIVADHQQQAENRRAIRAAAAEQTSRLEAKHRRFALNDERFLARESAEGGRGTISSLPVTVAS